MNDTTAPAKAEYDRLSPSATYHSLRLDELQSEDEVLRLAGKSLWLLAKYDTLVERIVADIEDARMIREGARLALEGDLQI